MSAVGGIAMDANDSGGHRGSMGGEDNLAVMVWSCVRLADGRVTANGD